MCDQQTGDSKVRDATPDQAAPTQAAPAQPRRVGMGAAVGLIWGLIGGIAAWELLVAVGPIFRLSEELLAVNMYSPPAMIAAQRKAGALADRRNNVVTLAQIGGLVGALLGFGDGLARRSGLRAAGGLALVGILGAAFAVLGCWLGQAAMDGYTAYYGQVGPDTELYRTILVHAVMLGTMGGGIGLGLGILHGRLAGVVSPILAGVLAGCFAGMVYPFAAARLLPEQVTENLLPDGNLNRLLWIAITAAFLGLTIPGMKLSRPPKSGGVAV